MIQLLKISHAFWGTESPCHASTYILCLSHCYYDRDAAPGLPLVLRALHKYHIAEQAQESMDYSNAEARSACEGAQRLVCMLCERLCGAWGSSAVVSAANAIR